MISISDNTAADHLIARLGRRSVEAAMTAIGVTTTARYTPLLTTADMARLKFVAPASGTRYLAPDSVARQRRFLTRLPALVPFAWESAVVELLARNPGVAADVCRRWSAVRFKGGSEPGVLAFASSFRRPGVHRVAVLGWSDPARLIGPSPAGEAALRAVLGLARELEPGPRRVPGSPTPASVRRG